MSATITAPSQASLTQKERALDVANSTKAIRVLARRETGRRGREGAHYLADLLVEPPAAFKTAYVWQVIQWVPGLGETKTRSVLRAAAIDPWRKVGRLTPRQRGVLVEQLRSFAEVTVRPPRVRPARVSSLVCRECGERMRKASDDGRCGFCVAGLGV